MPSCQTRFILRAALALPLLAAAITAWAPTACAAAVPAPTFEPGDSWTYEIVKNVRGTLRTGHETMTLTRVDDHLLSIETRPAGSDAPGREMLANPDWSRTRSVDGKLTTVNRPLLFPLGPGKSWSIDFTENTPADRRHSRERIEMTYRVAGWEEVTVPAGTFRTLRIEGEGKWTVELPPNTLTQAGRGADGSRVVTMTRQGNRLFSGRQLFTYWYVPEVHRWVRSEEDTYDNNGVRTEQTTAALESFKVAESAPVAEAVPKETVPKIEKPHRAPAKKAAKAAVKPTAPEAAPPAVPTGSDRPLLQELRFPVPKDGAAAAAAGGRGSGI